MPACGMARAGGGKIKLLHALTATTQTTPRYGQPKCVGRATTERKRAATSVNVNEGVILEHQLYFPFS